jgi:hypothetical protein
VAWLAGIPLDKFILDNTATVKDLDAPLTGISLLLCGPAPGEGKEPVLQICALFPPAFDLLEEGGAQLLAHQTRVGTSIKRNYHRRLKNKLSPSCHTLYVCMLMEDVTASAITQKVATTTPLQQQHPMARFLCSVRLL